jgi:PTH1 family peptidyl-tRNA hydrolase
VGEPWLVAGLGNPGDRYAKTRHNVGRMALDVLCERFGVRLRRQRFVGVEAAEARTDGGAASLLLVRAATAFMNVSGPPIASFARKRGVPADRVIAIHDELDLAFGALRVKIGGSTAGHHGLDSLVQALRSPDFYRVRIGIGRPSGRQDPADFVLEPFPAREREDAMVTVHDAADAAVALTTEGLEAAQARFNRAGIAG